APWADVPAWAPLVAIGAVAAAIARLRGNPVPAPAVPWRIGVQILALVLSSDALADRLHLTAPAPTSVWALVAVAMVAASIAATINNLPASAVLAGLLGARGDTAYAALAGLSVGALATPHGSVATMIAFDRAGIPPPPPAGH